MKVREKMNKEQVFTICQHFTWCPVAQGFFSVDQAVNF